ncbi:MAG: hypothetical protein J7K26_03315 [Candidatus Aenigmarchaeota archaeon]|nr:hypothetical protein [Candidatus Aenigmarchaeota archaeon]
MKAINSNLIALLVAVIFLVIAIIVLLFIGGGAKEQGTTITKQQMFSNLCLQWRKEGCALDKYEDIFDTQEKDSLCNGELYNSIQECQLICNNMCNPYVGGD